MATLTLPGADIHGFYQRLGIELPERPCFEASVRCFANPTRIAVKTATPRAQSTW
jgi:hypothetical protein